MPQEQSAYPGSAEESDVAGDACDEDLLDDEDADSDDELDLGDAQEGALAAGTMRSYAARSLAKNGVSSKTLLIPSTAGGRPLIEQQFFVEGECDGWRLDRFLQKRMRRMSRNRIQHAIRGDCEVAGRRARPGMRVFRGQVVVYRREAPAEPVVPREISVLHADPAFYVISKPAGLPIHPSARYHLSTLTAVLREKFPSELLQVAHRLDRETSGLMLVGRDRAASAALKGAFQRRLVHKRYLAIVHGRVQDDHFVVDAPMGAANSEVRVRMAVRALSDGGVPAKTEFSVLQRTALYTLLECRPYTGRQHQIRVHLHHVGHPIVGDKLYPDEALFLRWVKEGDAAVEAELPLARHALHACGIVFPHPRTGDRVEAHCALPDDLATFLAQQVHTTET